MFKYIIPFLLTLPFFCANAEEVKERKKPLTVVNIEKLEILDGSTEHAIKLLKQLRIGSHIAPPASQMQPEVLFKDKGINFLIQRNSFLFLIDNE